MRIVLIVACMLAVTSAAFAAIQDPIKTEAGLISGTSGSSPEVRVYKGIPYAAPPDGALRWREPQPVSPWQGQLQAEKRACSETELEQAG